MKILKSIYIYVSSKKQLVYTAATTEHLEKRIIGKMTV